MNDPKLADVASNGLARKSSLLSKSAEGATFLIILQVGSRALTFTVNQLLLRYLSPELLGISTQLEVYYISVLFFAREALRVAVQRQTDSNEDTQRSKQNPVEKWTKKYLAARKTQELVNLAYVSVCLGIVFAVGLGWGYLRSLSSAPYILVTPYFKQALQLYGIAAFWELLVEPCFLVVQQKSKYRIRAAAESCATIVRCIVTCACAVLASRRGIDVGVLPFAFGQWMYGLSLLFVYYGQIWTIASTSGFSLIPRRIASKYSMS
jgi:oligosaccharide translocation protein RFT1